MSQAAAAGAPLRIRPERQGERTHRHVPDLREAQLGGSEGPYEPLLGHWLPYTNSGDKLSEGIGRKP